MGESFFGVCVCQVRAYNNGIQKGAAIFPIQLNKDSASAMMRIRFKAYGNSRQDIAGRIGSLLSHVIHVS